MKQDRLFVPLITEHWEAFNAGTKLWEVRNAVHNFSPKRVRLNRAAELSKGYSKGNRDWRKIVEVEVFDTVEALLSQIPYGHILPNASSQQQAHQVIIDLLGTEHKKIAFRPVHTSLS
jgi:ASC-1-like (ASCH) protein